MTQVLDAEWRLDSITIEFQQWGDYKGKYMGKIKFENREKEAFMFNIRPEMAEDYLRLIQGELVRNASTLGEKLLNSLNLLPETKKQIGETIEVLP